MQDRYCVENTVEYVLLSADMALRRITSFGFKMFLINTVHLHTHVIH